MGPQCGGEKESRWIQIISGVIVDCGKAMTQSSESRKDTDTQTLKEGEVYLWPRAGPSVSPICLQPDRTGHDLCLGGRFGGDFQDELVGCSWQARTINVQGFIS